MTTGLILIIFILSHTTHSLAGVNTTRLTADQYILSRSECYEVAGDYIELARDIYKHYENEDIKLDLTLLDSYYLPYEYEHYIPFIGIGTKCERIYYQAKKAFLNGEEFTEEDAKKIIEDPYFSVYIIMFSTESRRDIQPEDYYLMLSIPVLDENNEVTVNNHYIVKEGIKAVDIKKTWTDYVILHGGKVVYRIFIEYRFLYKDLPKRIPLRNGKVVVPSYYAFLNTLDNDRVYTFEIDLKRKEN